MLSVGTFILFLLLLLPNIESARRLNEYISHFEPLTYDTSEVARAHGRHKRSLNADEHVHINFAAHGRHFRLRMKRDASVFGESLVVEQSGSPVAVDSRHIYHGHLIGEPNSYAFGSISDGIFEGKIVSTTSGSYYVEKTHHFFPRENSSSPTFHSVIYADSDVEDPYEKQRTGHVGGCGITDDVVQWMDRIQNSAIEEPAGEQCLDKKSSCSKKTLRAGGGESPKNLYSSSEKGKEEKSNRVKRGARSPKEENRNTCSLFIQTDPLIWRHISE
ncbi:hypothetical protein J437_LFUL012133, partial [Ladona fulva]